MNRQTKKDYRIIKAAIFLLLVATMPIANRANASSRRLAPGAQMPEFSPADPNASAFTYNPKAQKALLLVFLSAQQKQSESAVQDIVAIMLDLPVEPNKLDLAFVTDKPFDPDIFKTDPEKTKHRPNILIDTDRHIWGKFGIIATPTVIIAGTDGKVAWVKPGHGYDFAPALRYALNDALGIPQTIDPKTIGKVKTASHNSQKARISRHLQMAKMLEKKGRFHAAIQQLQKSLDVDPNSLQENLALARLYSKNDQPDEALKVAEKIKNSPEIDKAQITFILGTINAKLDQPDKALEYLLEASKLTPRSPEVLFELGKIYEKLNQPENANTAYRKAIMILLHNK